MSEVEPKPAGTATTGGKSETLARKFVVAFSAMFVVPLLLAFYIFTESASGGIQDPTRVAALAAFVILLGTAGFFLTRSVVHALLRAARESAAIAEGDISRRLSTDTASEISELARNFNRITSRLQQ
ncbi:MAG TPA: HAMP domain-containing protein, partial [Candidatus Deferrimicrobiaceae bacterium]|nr:HAMP domain-containing protein [Candidatus Deferrimicrobiaceae bacterium]